ncbi:hypothetical protein JMJ77_0007141, partial [Colletotrichum scovillei]
MSHYTRTKIVFSISCELIPSIYLRRSTFMSSSRRSEVIPTDVWRLTWV